MNKKIFILLVLIVFISGCSSNNNTNTNSDDDNKKLSKEEIALKEDGYTKKIDNSNFDMSCFDNIKYHFDDNVFISGDGSICLVNYEKAFSKSKKNTLIIDSKLNDTVYGAMRYDSNNTYYFVTDKGMFKLDDSYNFVSVTDSIEMNNFAFRGNEVLGAIQMTDFDKIFFTNGNFFVLKNSSLYKFDYVSVYEDLGENGNKGYVLYSDKNMVNTSSINENIIDYIRGNFFGDILVTDNGYYRRVITNKDEVEKYNDVKEKYEFVKLNISNYKSKVKYLSSSYVIVDGNIYSYIPKGMRENYE